MKYNVVNGVNKMMNEINELYIKVDLCCLHMSGKSKSRNLHVLEIRFLTRARVIWPVVSCVEHFMPLLLHVSRAEKGNQVAGEACRA